MIVVAIQSVLSLGMPMIEFGEMSMDFLPRTRRTRPVWPVRILSPGCRTVAAVTEACWTPELVTQTSPDDLLAC
jgi:hypothetical protein